MNAALLDQDGYFFNRFTSVEVMSSLKHLKNGKSPGQDGIYSEHFKLAHDKVSIILSLLFNAMIIHGYLPEKVMDTILTPIVKDKKGNITDSDNYRPVAIACVSSKMFELLLLSRCSDSINTTPNQFGFKAKLGADLCVYSFKQVVEYYKSLSSPVYVAYLDASKAFDKVNHYHLMFKLLKCGVPVIIVRLLYFWYQNQNFIIRWGGCLSDSFTVCNGVRQGSIASPLFFNVYLNELSIELND